MRRGKYSSSMEVAGRSQEKEPTDFAMRPMSTKQQYNTEIRELDDIDKKILTTISLFKKVDGWISVTHSQISFQSGIPERTIRRRLRALEGHFLEFNGNRKRPSMKFYTATYDFLYGHFERRSAYKIQKAVASSVLCGSDDVCRNDYRDPLTDGASKLFNIYNNTSIDNTTRMPGFSLKGIEYGNENTEDDENHTMGTENTKAVVQAYRRGGSKFKAKAFKKSAANLLARYGDKIEKLIQDHGEDAVITGVENFLQDEYWIKNGLPLTAFLKSAHKWIPEPDKSPNDTFYRPSKFKKPSTGFEKLDLDLARRVLSFLENNPI